MRRLFMEKSGWKEKDVQWSAMMGPPHLNVEAAFRRSPNVLRREFACTVKDDFWYRGDTSLTGLTAWEERVTINRTVKNEKALCKLVAVQR